MGVMESRNKTIIRTSVVGILANTFLSGFKAVIGLMTNSIAIVLDAVNNLSDAAASLITIIGTKLAGREPDKKHPFGYGRIEYLSALVISLLVLYAGITSLTESIKKIITPETPDYNVPALVIVGVAVLVKIGLGIYVKRVGVKVHSDSLVNSGEDARLDAVISTSTLVAAIVFMVFGVSLEAYLGAVISLVIIKSGFEMIRDTVSRLLGEHVDAELARDIKATVRSFDGVKGVYDLVLNNYGPDTYNGSVHIEVQDTCTAADIDELIRGITEKVYAEHQVILSGISVYSQNTKDAAISAMQKQIYQAILAHQHVRGVHGFYMNEAKKKIRFDVVVSFDAGNRREVYEAIRQEIEGLYPDYSLEMTLDIDFSEI